MKYCLLFLLFLIAVSCATNKTHKKQIKSIKGYQDSINVSIEVYDEYNRLIFDKTSQIIDDWNGELLTWMTTTIYEGNKKTHEYYAHSNHILRETVFDYYQDGKFRGEYNRTYDFRNRKRNPFDAIHNFSSSDSLIRYIKCVIPDNVKFKNTTESYIEYFDTYTDSSGLIIKEFVTLELDSSLVKQVIEKYNESGNLVTLRTDTPNNSDLIEYKYDSAGRLDEEIERYDLVNDRVQRKVYLYEDRDYIKELFYHGEDLAFIYEYFYKDSLLVKKVTNRVTNAAGFKNRPRNEVIEYFYEFYEQ